jgi:hypothetical protein
LLLDLGGSNAREPARAPHHQEIFVTALTTSTGNVAASAPMTDRSIPLALRIALAVAAPLAPLAQGLGYLISPYGNSDDPASIFRGAASPPGSVATLSWLSVIIGIALVPGVIATGMAALSRAPRLATVALLIAVPGWGVALVAPSIDIVAHAAFATGVPEHDAVRMLGYLLNFTMPALGFVILLFVVGHVLGTVLLGIALYHSRAIPRVVAVLLAIAQPLHFAAFVVLQNTYLDVAAAWLTAIGFGAAGLSLLRSSSWRAKPVYLVKTFEQDRPGGTAIPTRKWQP